MPLQLRVAETVPAPPTLKLCVVVPPLVTLPLKLWVTPVGAGVAVADTVVAVAVGATAEVVAVAGGATGAVVGVAVGATRAVVGVAVATVVGVVALVVDPQTTGELGPTAFNALQALIRP